jgi:hypothetical protein
LVSELQIEIPIDKRVPGAFFYGVDRLK